MLSCLTLYSSPAITCFTYIIIIIIIIIITCFTSPSPRTSWPATSRLGDSASITDRSWAMIRVRARLSGVNWSSVKQQLNYSN